MKRLSIYTLVFSLFSLFFFIILIFFRKPFTFYSFMSVQDILDLLTPLVLIPIYWVLFQNSARGESRSEEISFMVLASFWVLGQGIHLAANSINNLAGALFEQESINISGSDLYQLIYFLDEILSHYIWHLGVIGLAVLLVYREWVRPAGVKTIWWVTILGGLIYGFTCFCIFLEGQTTNLGLPFSFLFTLLVVTLGRKKMAHQPILAFFFVSFLFTALLFTGWGLYYGGFPEPSSVGII